MNFTGTYIDCIREYIINHKLFYTNYKSKYTLNEILDIIEYIFITGASW